MTIACDTKSAPGPPHSLGTASVRKPSFEPFSMMLQSQGSNAPSVWSRWSEIGLISSWAKRRASCCQPRCSSFSEKSIEAPSGSHGLLIARDRFGDGELGRAVAVIRMQEHHRVVHVLLQRHVAHHAHGAEALGGE